MINLLPPEKKEEIRNERNWKISLILSVNLIAVFVCLGLVLFLINIFLSSKIDFQNIIYQEKEKDFNSLKTQTLSQNLEIFNQTFSRLDSFYQNQFRATKTLESVSRDIPTGIYLTNLLINPKKEVEITECVLTGFSANRDALLKFKENLEKKEEIKDVYFPTSSWVKATDINFTINFKIKWQ
jgi:Tfp pilus assembly protein PilN